MLRNFISINLAYNKFILFDYNKYFVEYTIFMKKIVFTGGGTLGHVMPNIYLIDDLKSEYEIAYIGGAGIEKEKLATCNIDYYEIPTVKLIRGKILSNLKIPFVLINATIKAKKTLKKLKPTVIFSKGGYVSLPVCLAGKMLKIPIVTHESDYSLGLANKIILKTCNTMCVNFKNLESVNKKITYTGPIFSQEFESKTKGKTKLNLNSNKKTILIVGGSLGSKKINEVIFPCVKDLIKEFNIIHITGKGNNDLKSYDNYNAFEITDDMAYLYDISDILIGRSGAGVTAESYFKKLPMILIPLENKATRGDQLQNAKYYQKQGVAEIIRESELTPTTLLSGIENMEKNFKKYEENYKKAEISNGKGKILKILEKYLR